MAVPPTPDPVELKAQKEKQARETQTIAADALNLCDFGSFVEQSDPIVKAFFALTSSAKDARGELLKNIILEMKVHRDRFANLPLHWCSSEYQRKLKNAMDCLVEGWEMSRDGGNPTEIRNKFNESEVWLGVATDEIKNSLKYITPKPK